MIGARLIRESFRAMGTECTVAVTATSKDNTRARRALAAGLAEIASCEQALSRFRRDSDLSRLNAARGESVTVDERLIEVLRVALRIREETGGRFDPTILPALVATGYDRSFEQLEERPAAAAGWRSGALVELDAPAEKASGMSRSRSRRRSRRHRQGLRCRAHPLGDARKPRFELPGGLVDLRRGHSGLGSHPGAAPGGSPSPTLTSPALLSRSSGSATAPWPPPDVTSDASYRIDTFTISSTPRRARGWCRTTGRDHRRQRWRRSQGLRHRPCDRNSQLKRLPS